VAGEYSVMVIDLLGKYYKICSTTAVQGFLWRLCSTDQMVRTQLLLAESVQISILSFLTLDGFLVWIYPFLQMFQTNESDDMHSKGISSSWYKIKPNNVLMGLGRKANQVCIFIYLGIC
jgi:hypothetical protein